MEYSVKALRYGNKASCIPPKNYGERFFTFMHETFDLQ
jgi:hypothetical protein